MRYNVRYKWNSKDIQYQTYIEEKENQTPNKVGKINGLSLPQILLHTIYPHLSTPDGALLFLRVLWCFYHRILNYLFLADFSAHSAISNSKRAETTLAII